MEFSELRDYVIAGDAPAAEEWTRRALDEGMDPMAIINEGLIAGMTEVGEKFKNFEYYLPEMLVSARAMKTAMALVKPLATKDAKSDKGTAIIGTVKGDLHDIGKTLVGMMLEGAGFEVIDLGVDVDAEAFLQALEENDAQLLCLSSLLTTTMPYMETVVSFMADAEIRQRIKIMVGGAPVSDDYASDIGADGYAADAVSAAEMAKELLGIEVA